MSHVIYIHVKSATLRLRSVRGKEKLMEEKIRGDRKYDRKKKENNFPL